MEVMICAQVRKLQNTISSNQTHMKNCTEEERSFQLSYQLKMLMDVGGAKYEMATI